MKTTISLAFGLALMTSSFAQHGVDPNWGNEVLLPRHFENQNSKQRGVLFNNNIATSIGKIIILTSEVNPTNSSQLYGYSFITSTNGGANWTTQQFSPPIPSGGLKLAITPQDTVFALWTSGSVGSPAIFITKLDANLNVIKDSVRVSNSQLHGNFKTHFTTDKYGRIHVMWHEGEPKTSQTAVCYYTRSIDGGNTWQPTQMISNNLGKHAAYPHAEFDVAGDTLCIAWRDSINSSIPVRGRWDVSGCFSTNGGLTWTTAQPIIATTDADWDPDVLIDPQGRIHLFYHVYPANFPTSKAYIRYQYTDNVGSSWNMPTNLPSGHPTGQLSQPTIASHLIEGTRFDLANGILWTTWKDERDFVIGNSKADMMAAYSVDRGVTWSSPEFVTDRNDSIVGFKSAALLPTGEFFVNYEVWSNHSPNDANGFMRIYFRKRQLITASIEKHEIQNEQFTIYPNPFSTQTTVQTDVPQTNAILTIVNCFGQTVVEIKNFNGQTITLQRNDLPAGLYFVQLTEDNKQIATKKIIIAD